MLSSYRVTLVAFLLAAASCRAPGRPSDGARAVDELFPGAVAHGGPYVTRLVDDLTGAPIAGAEVFLVDESATPLAGEFWFRARGVSDADGFVRVPLPPGARSYGWQVVHHPNVGLGARMDHEGIWRLGRPFDLPVRIVDWAGRPAVGAGIGFCAGCGHSPDLVNAAADADGRAVLRGVDPQSSIADLYVQHPGLHMFYESVVWRPGEAPMEVRCRPGPAQRGRVLDHLGRPVAGAFVGVGHRHRGPWGRTAADGSYTVLGAEPGESAYIVVTSAGRKVYLDAPRHVSPVTIRLPDLSDAKSVHGTVDEPEPDAPPPLQTRTLRVVVENAPSERLELAAWYPPLVRRSERATGSVVVPAAGPFELWVSDASVREDSERRFTFADAAVLPDPIVVRWVPDVRIGGRAVDERGAPLAVRARWCSPWQPSGDGREDEWCTFPAGRFELPHRGRGHALLELRVEPAPADSPIVAAPVRPRLVWVNVPPRDAGPASVDLGDVVVGGAPQLRIVDERGAPLPNAAAAFRRAGWLEAGDGSAWPLDEHGAWCGPDLRAGDTIVVHRDPGDDSVPFVTELRGDGPWTIVPPAGELALDVVDVHGEHVKATVIVGDQERHAFGQTVLRGLPHGHHRLWISRVGMRSVILDTTVGPTRRVERVVLPPREP